MTQADLLLSATPCLDTGENLFPTVKQDEILSGHIELTRLKEHAQGAIGKVYVAQDPQLNRKVAIKCLQARHVTNDHYRNRFLIEAEITSRLNHPGVIPVHGVGETKAGCPFYVMPFVEGGFNNHRYLLPELQSLFLDQEQLSFGNVSIFSHLRNHRIRTHPRHCAS